MYGLSQQKRQIQSIKRKIWVVLLKQKWDEKLGRANQKTSDSESDSVNYLGRGA